MSKQLTEKDLIQFGIDYMAGMPIKQMEIKYNMDRTTVNRYRRRLGLPLRDPGNKGALATKEVIKRARRKLTRLLETGELE